MHVLWEVNGHKITIDQKLQITDVLQVIPPEIALPCTGHPDKWWSNFEVTHHFINGNGRASAMPPKGQSRVFSKLGYKEGKQFLWHNNVMCFTQ